ncbi:hypothetical protein PVK06_046903 [Gossypium arboreum]|uniref:Uncharacterized protein n=1 Tax=Gossypium arboreum TaxID=29729 RepID=A0ABR0MDX4_GOSAR|nr:hypothetical protein PVK06_046903 [Gossypium arboreum]
MYGRTEGRTWERWRLLKTGTYGGTGREARLRRKARESPKFNQLDTRIDAPLKDFQERIKNEVRSEVRSKFHSKLHSLFEQYFSQTPPTVVTGLIPNKRKGILDESPPGFPSREQFVVSPIPDLRHTGVSSRVSNLDVGSTLFRVDCLHFYGSNFRGWWFKFEKYFESEGVGNHARVRMGGLHRVTWDLYAKDLNERFGSDSFLDPMAKLVSLRQQGFADQFHDRFRSQGHNTMRFSTLIDQSEVIVLVDSGSTQFCGLQSS